MDVQLKIVEFSGRKKEWDRWSITFLSTERLKDYRNLLMGIKTMPAKGSKGFEDFVNKNDFAFADLLISCKSDVCLGLVNASRLEELPEGDVCLVWTNMISKFAPVTKYNLIKTMKELNDSKLDDISQDPDEWIQSLEILRQRLIILVHPINEMDFIIHIMLDLPEEYKNTIKFIQNELEDGKILIEKVKEYLRMKFERLNTLAAKNETALVSVGKFKGNCSFCGTYGHRDRDCKKKAGFKKKDQGSNETTLNPVMTNGFGNNKKHITCYCCQKKGHIARDFPRKNQKKGSNESVQVTGENKVTLVGIEAGIALASQQSDIIPNHPWNGDSGSSCHIAYKDIGMFDTVYSNAYLTVGGGRKLQIEKIGKMRLSFEGRDGKFREVILHNVNHVPEMRMNLISTNRASDS
jgi:hypothetical protein